ncbi:MAG: type II toxin-antitoxin system RelE/ParE family toxin [Planctomycetota bacterium]
MSRDIRWSRRAADRLEEAALYFESARDDAGMRFLEDVQETLERVAFAPMACPGIPGEPETTRRAVLPRFGYWIVYEVESDAIVVLTLWSAVRKPSSWKSDID